MLQRRVWRGHTHLCQKARLNQDVGVQNQIRHLSTRPRRQQHQPTAAGAQLLELQQCATSATARSSTLAAGRRVQQLALFHGRVVIPQRGHAPSSCPGGDGQRRVTGCGAHPPPEEVVLWSMVPSPESQAPAAAVNHQPLAPTPSVGGLVSGPVWMSNLAGRPFSLGQAQRRGCLPSLSSRQTSCLAPRRLFSSGQRRPSQQEGSSGQKGPSDTGGGGDGNATLGWRMVEAAATSFASILVLAFGFGAAGYAYHKFYKHLVLEKMQNAFEPGDPVLDLAAMSKGMVQPTQPRTNGEHVDRANHWVHRPEQETVDGIVAGLQVGHYYLFLGDKGTGKSSMLLDAMRKIDGDGVAMFEAHADLEIFRIRLGKALDYEYHEDYIGGYFSERGPRDTTALLDIERALNKLEKVAMLNRKKRPGRPLVVIINQMHLVRDDDDGKDLLELLQQRAEQWAAAGLVTIVFNSDDYWVYERFKQLATRMEVLSVRDLPKAPATAALKRYRHRYFGETLSDDMAERVYDKVGGRLSFLNRVAKSGNMLKTCDKIIQNEKTWFLNQCWILGSEMDDDVMDQQKWAAAAMVLALALVDKEAETEKSYDPVEGHVLPSFALHEAQEIMTRADFVRALDRLNLFTITSSAQVRASSVPMHQAFREICAEPRFRQHLEDTIERIADIESLGRTRELVAKDLVIGGQYEIDLGSAAGAGGKSKAVVTLRELPGNRPAASTRPKE